jgi:hypothetical protein
MNEVGNEMIYGMYFVCIIYERKEIGRLVQNSQKSGECEKESLSERSDQK